VGGTSGSEGDTALSTASCPIEKLPESWWVDNEIDKTFTKEHALMKQRGTKIRALIPLTSTRRCGNGRTARRISAFPACH
jgi:hypothetical protein